MQPNRTDWLSVHRDDQLSATSPLMGKPGEPREQWRVFLGGRIRVAETVESLTTPGHLDLLIIDRGGIHRVTAGGDTVWRSRPAGYWLIACTGDIDADGNTEIVATDGIHIHVLDARNGERIWAYRMPPSAGVQPASITAHAFSGARGIQLVVGIMYSTDLLVIDWEAGARNGRVRTLHTDDMYHPALFIADMDNDGEEEIVVTKLCGIYQFSPATLALKKSYTWLSDGRRLRNYGLFQAVDVNNDGRLEVVVLASLVARHLAVVGNDGAGNLSVWWDRYIEMIYPTDTTEVRWVMNSVADVNGDGRPEIAVSLFNTRGDGRWWMEIIDPLDGRLLAELPDSYLWESRDIDGDGWAEILVSTAMQRSVPPRGQLQVYRWVASNAPMQRIWQDADARFAAHFKLNAPGLTAFRTDLVNDSEVWPAPDTHRHGFLIWKRAGATTRLLAIDLQSGGQQVLAELPDSAEGLDAAPELLAMRDLDGDGRNELVIGTLLGELVIAKAGTAGAVHIATGHSAGARLGSTGAPFTPVVWRGRDGRARIAVHDLFDRLRLYSVDPARADSPELLAALPGVGQSLVDSIRVAAYAADVNADGQPEVLCARPRAGGGSALAAIDENGATVRQWDFADVQPGSAETRLGLYAWGVFDGTLIASWYQSLSMNTESSSAFDLGGGKRLWHIPHVFDGEDRAASDRGTCAFTRQEDGILFLAKDTVCHIDIRSGAWLHQPGMLRPYTDAAAARTPAPGMMDGFTAYGNIALRDVNGDGLAEYVVLGMPRCFRLLPSDATISPSGGA